MQLKIISLNLYEGGLLFDAIFNFLDKEQPDILLLQEVNNSSEKELAQHFRSLEVLKNHFPEWEHRYDPEFVAVRPQGKIPIGNAIFSKFPVQKNWHHHFGIPYGEFVSPPVDNDFSKHPKNIQCCQIEINGSMYLICNLHGIWGLDGKDTPERLAMAETILNQLQGYQNIILGGDFNVQADTQTISKIEKKLKNVFKNSLTTSFNPKRKNLSKFPGYATAVVDVLFVSDNIKVVNKKCPQVDVSDHLPLIVTIEI